MAAPKPDTSRMTVDLLPGQRVDIGGVSVEVLHKTGRHSRLRIHAPREVPIRRSGEQESRRGSVPIMAECQPD